VIKAIFLDRDGVINRKAPEGRYITRQEEFQFLPKVAEAISSLKQAGFKVSVVTNQRCLAKGLMTERDLKSMHEWMCGVLAMSGASLDDIYYCPHEEFPRCDCRKPEPGMLLKGAREHEIDLGASWMIGDSDSDMEAGRRAGCRTAQVIEADARVGMSKAEIVAGSLFEVVEQILAACGRERAHVQAAHSDRSSPVVATRAR
jgi:D-glycero-D-manno-heptose 1,7-bisphosphate phosphatase